MNMKSIALFLFKLADYFKSDTKSLAAQIITKGRFTVYSHIGDILVYLCILYLFMLFIYKLKK